MPYTPEEGAAVALRLARREIAIDDLTGIVWEDGTAITDLEARYVCAMAVYELSLRAQRRAARCKEQRRGLALLRSLLTPAQRQTLANKRCFYVRGSLGGMYALYPGTGSTHQVEKHGKRWYSMRLFCLHDAEGCPNADRATAHLLLLSCDEGEFLRLANKTERPNDAWNGAYLRQHRVQRKRKANV